ncbi:hypothetical protein DQ04_00591160 [Trypanosoma grayi]|uniref:hypothetical protein n=1 Tax=Trypanosoma grayi TaxID=71804 RepID=UPI0004F44508|nr:hypothetical protein DQ04_00591160 [Trypanosoma grayi]KEG14175.1 hypothetical protein DQ04_00591160 [Trypanosoma grayi]
MLEAIIIVPFGVALWALSKKQARQKEIIGALEATIVSQRQELDRLLQTGNVLSSARLAAFSAVVAAGVCVCFLLFRPGSASPLRCDLPPPTYTPNLARHDEEECVVCMNHKRDTLFEPCRHLCVCWPCSRAMHTCPLCRQEITSCQFTFIP